MVPNRASSRRRLRISRSHLSGFADKLEKAGSSANEISTLRGLATADTSTLSAIIGLLAGASPSLQTAIGTALGQAARVHLIPDQTFAPDIQVQSAAAKSDVANTAYAATSVDAPIGSVANGGAGGGVSIGGPAGGSNGNSGAGGFQSIGINNPSFFSVVTTRASSAASSAATSVSL